MQRSCADVNESAELTQGALYTVANSLLWETPPKNESAELTQGAFYLIHYSFTRHSFQPAQIFRMCSVNSPLYVYYRLINVLSEGALGDLGEYPGHGVDPVHRIVFHQLDHLQPVRAELPFWNRRFSVQGILSFISWTGETNVLNK